MRISLHFLCRTALPTVLVGAIHESPVKIITPNKIMHFFCAALGSNLSRKQKSTALQCFLFTKEGEINLGMLSHSIALGQL